MDKYGCSVRRHIEDGVCLPAGYLSRHVSRRSIYNIFLYFLHRVRIV